MNEFLNKLPFEIWSIIFEFIDVQELLNFKLICKKFNHLINQLKFEELIILKRGGFCNSNWYNLKLVNLRNTIICDQISYLDNQSFFNNLSKIKYLKAEINEDHFEKLNQLTNLEHLETNNYLKFDDDINLTLPNLKILEIWFKMEKEKFMVIDAPKLEIIKCVRLKHIKFINPQSIKTIEVNTSKSDNEFENINQFTNLEVFKCDDVLNDKLIYQSPKTLKSIHIYCDYIMRAINGDQSDRVSIDFVNKIVNDRIELNRNDLKLYFNGIELIGDQKFDDYGFQYLQDFNQMISYYDQFESKSNWFNRIDFYDFEYYKPSWLKPLDFFKRFPNIQHVIIGNEEFDPEKVLEFLKYCPNISFLELINNKTCDNQSFFDQLPLFIKNLRTFSRFFLREDNENEIELDYSFILNFKFINRISTTHSLSIGFILNLFRRNKFFDEVRCKNYSLHIEKDSKNSFYLSSNKLEWNNLNENELVDLFNDLELNKGLKSDLYKDKKIYHENEIGNIDNDYNPENIDNVEENINTPDDDW